ncbi:MAG: insulinase family protein [Candidatus Gastranaerophilales bacterium]|nr:insulinase family protein [Candidatus Gastranaerophilales bacterium]
MSFQYINPYLVPKNNYNQFYQANNFSQFSTPQYVQNPYEASFYNQNYIYPFNPLYMPKIGQNYFSLGQIQTPNNDTVHLFQLLNGQKVAIVPRKDEATIVKTYLDGGSMNETDKIRGISHCIEHCLFKGSDKLEDGDVFRLTSLMGASTNASTDYAQTDYYITAPYMDCENLAKTIEIQGDMICNPKFDINAIESEKGPIKSEISMINDDVFTRAFDKVIRNLFQINSTSDNLVAGSIETVSNLTREDIVNHHNKYYTPQNLYTVVVGDVDVNETMDLISKNFTLPTKTNTGQLKEILTPIQKPVREDIISPKIQYTGVIMAFAGPKPQDSKDAIVTSMINYYLQNCSSSDLKKKLEEISGSYDCATQKVGLNPNDPTAKVCMISLNPKDEQKGIDIFYDAIQKLQNKPLSNEDLIAIKNMMKKDVEYEMSDSVGICESLGKNLLGNSLDGFSNYKTILENVTQEDIINCARKYFDLNKVSIVVVHPKDITKEEIDSNYNSSKYSYNNVVLKQPNQTIAFTGMKKNVVEKVEEYTLQNNTRLVLNPTNSDICAFQWSINTPPIKPKNPNAPSVLAYMFHKGTTYKNQNELEKFKELNAIDTDVFVNGRSIEISADCLSENCQKTLSLMNELLYHPKFSREDFNEAKRYIKDSLKASQKDATSNLLDNLYPGFFPTEATMLKTIDDLTLDDVKEFYSQILNSASSTFVATAPINTHPELRQEIINYQSASNITFKDSTPKLSPIFTPNKESNVVVDTDTLNQAQIYKTYKFPMSGNILDEAKFELVNTILGGSPNSRLFKDLREKQNLAYSVSSTIQSFENTGIITLKIQTTTDDKEQNVLSYDNVQKSLEGFNKHVNQLCTEQVTDEELAAAKMKLKQNLTGICQDPLSETGLLAMNAQEPYGIKRIDKYIEAIDKITKEDIQKASQFMFSFNPTISILASPETIDSQINYLRTQGRIDFINS